MTYFYMAETMI